ncbi:MAG: isoprenyl transferase [Bacteroidetes bacterium]|nr:isoprenyl transferase [Bacteroidota bacterium]MBU1373200.1 isoprenyl transferase [Bacteroidota bacterium]MBU1486272.1 isoprenyl transferase [Bacteroidota bacterium]MBU1759285.1 isoprenyl transferase [Bacteroidota bacterium]MBU2045628.1 isoprenyl transferase [Bacteroidota bacterium]
MSFREKLNLDKLPEHVAIIMDGNGRWAKEKGKMRVFGHKNGVLAVRDTVEGAAEVGIKNLTLYAFSTENWNRPKLEVTALMELLVSSINKETKTLMENNVKLNAIGDLESLPKRCYHELLEAIAKTSNNSRLTLTLALSYSSRWEILNATKKIVADTTSGKLKADDINEKMFESYLSTHNLPDPELMIRTSGEHRISNYLLWQLAYAELYFTSTLWPDFRREDLFKAVYDYQQRERRFGLTSEQIG